MKKIALVFALCTCISCARDGYVIDGRIDGLEGEISLVDAFDHVISSTSVQKGRFSFEGRVDTPQLMYVNNGLGQATPIDAPVLLENARIKVRGNVKDYDITVSGTLPNNNMTEYIRRKKQIDEMDTDSYLALVRETFLANSGNLLGAMMISNMAPYVESGELLGYCEMLPDEFRASKMVSHYENVARAIESTSPGKPFADFEMDNQDGTPMTLSSAVAANKATVLVFWASWARLATEYLSGYAAACREHEKEGASMFSVSLDYNKEQWAKASDATGIFGINLCDTVEKTQAAIALYGFDGLPRAVVIGSDGTILARCRTGAEVKAALDGYFD